MANSMTPGEIYLIAEVDPITGEHTPYCKVGIVREHVTRDSENRRKDHQTGNPRELVTIATVKTAIVEAVETTLHGIYAPWRISGEWFVLNAEQRDEVLKRTRELADEAHLASVDMLAVKDLSKARSSGDLLPVDDASRRAHTDLSKARGRLKQIRQFMGLLESDLAVAITADGGTNRFGEIQMRKGVEKFDEVTFKEKHADLWDAFQKSKPVTPSFLPKNLAPVDEHEDLGRLTDRRLEALAEPVDTRYASLHGLYLEALSLEAVEDWAEDAASAKLKVLCGTAPGIDGLCTWVRDGKEKVSLDKAALKAAHPDVYAQYSSAGPGTEALVIAKDRGFRHE